MKYTWLTYLPLDKMATILQTTFSKIFSCMKSSIFLTKISLKFVPMGQIDNDPALVKIMAWRRIGDKPLSEAMLTQFTDTYAALGGDHYSDVIMGAIASQITSLTIVYSVVYSDADQRKHKSSASLALCVGNSPGT